MHIAKLYQTKKPVVSMEVFPPKPESPIEIVDQTLHELEQLSPDFISVTYGAGGSNSVRTASIAQKIVQSGRCEALAHLTCVGSNPEKIDAILDQLQAAGVENVLVLRGDIPKDMEEQDAFVHYRHASDLVRHLVQRGGFGITAACYPEGHYQSDDLISDILRLKEKVDCGVDTLITQLFFDNHAFFEYWDKLKCAGINVPLAAGIMPVLDPKQILRMTSLSGVSVPVKMAHIIAKYGRNLEDFRKAGIEYACEQVSDLVRNGVDGIHLYTMNKSAQIAQILRQTGLR